MTARNKGAYCVGSPSFNPNAAIKDSATHAKALRILDESDDFETAIRTWFALPPREKDDYVYHAITSIKLARVQQMVNDAAKSGISSVLHAWYMPNKNDLNPSPEDEDESPNWNLPPPPRQDVEAYISIFAPATQTASALKSFVSNAKRGSIRLAAGNYLVEKRFIHTGHRQYAQLNIAKVKPASKTPPPCNPYFDFWAWSCRHLEWCGPVQFPDADNTKGSSPSPGPGETEDVGPYLNPRITNPILPILMHHFGCAVPSHEALSILAVLAQGRPIVDVGSGSGYWTFMLRQYLKNETQVIPVDNAQSEWRAQWVSDTVLSDGTKWLKAHNGGKDHVLLIVYPIVGGGVAGGVEGGFVRSLVSAYKGDTIAVVGTQNRNGYTAFSNMTMDEFMVREHGDEWTKVVQIPLPSFAGKDEALFVFQRGERAPSPSSNASQASVAALPN